ncbi:uncharacterized protein LOC116209304 [Punica granatum]|nr:uncharacterized protein LOC116209304 [Punica granatum]OWM75118.1 hypothetical protein CDL15_Pgr017244 [Punica granatum]
MEEAAPTAGSPDVDIIRSRIGELTDLLRICKDVDPEAHPDSEKLVSQCAFDLEGRVEQILAQSSVAASFGPEDSSAFLEQLKEELNAVEVEKIKISDQIELLTKSVMSDSETLERDLEWLKWSLDHTELLGLEKITTGRCVDCFYRENQLSSTSGDACHKFEILDLQSQIEKKNKILKSLQSLDCEFKRYDIIEQIEDTLSGIKVIEFDQNIIRLSLKTYVPKFEGNQQKVEDAIETSEVNHEVLIEVVDTNLEIESVEIFPNDVYIADIVDAAKSFRQSFSQLTVPQTSLEWFIRKVMERIIISTLRRSVVKTANKLRYSVEYMERDNTITAHFLGGIDAILKASQGWPLCDSPLELISLKCSENSAKRVPLSVLRKVEEAMRSLEAQKRVKLLAFLNSIEAMLSEH